jgi:hypothetical protein
MFLFSQTNRTIRRDNDGKAFTPIPSPGKLQLFTIPLLNLNKKVVLLWHQASRATEF